MSTKFPARRRKAPIKTFVKGPTNYAGNKVRLLHRLLPEFGDLQEHTFVDLFSGGLNVGLNVQARHVAFNDCLPAAVDLARLLSSSTASQLEAEVATLVARYGLSDSYRLGYEHYGTDSSRGLASYNREQFLSLREDFNLGRFSGRGRMVVQFVLQVFGYNNQVQIRARDGYWTNSVGKRDFNSNVRQNLADSVTRLSQISHSIHGGDYRNLDLAQFDNPFVYVDPPYSISSATYNRSWLESDDFELFAFLDSLTAQGVPWVMSNVVEHRDVVNLALQRWLDRSALSVLHLDYDYRNVSHNHARRASSDEVLVLSPHALESRGRAAA